MNALTVGLGELVACYGLGLPILHRTAQDPVFSGAHVTGAPVVIR